MVLLILAGITINLLLADDGLFNKAQQSQLEQRKAEVLDQLYNAEAAVSVEYLGKPTIENFLDQIYKEQIVVEDDTEDLGNGVYNVYTEDGLVFEVSAIIGTNVNDIVYEYAGEAGNLSPAIRITNTTTNSVAIEVLRAEGVTEFKYSYKKQTEDSYTVAQESSNSNTYDYTGLTSNTIYDLQVEFTKDGKPVTLTKSVLIGEIPSGAIKLRSVTWSSGVATATIYTEEDGYQIEWQIGAIDEGNWTRAGEGIKETRIPNVQHGQMIYARLYDEVSSGKEANFDIRDEIAPQEAAITPSATEINLGESLTATVTHTDNESGVDVASCKWELNNSSTPLGTDENSYPNSFTSNGEQLTLTPTVGNNYLHVLTVDNAGNKKETVSTAIVVNAVTPEYWEATTEDDPNWYDYGTEVNAPVLGEGMIPIVYTESNEPTEKKWANAITADGSMWVWIPRYAYQIETGYHSSTVGTINIKFLKGTTDIAYDGTSKWDNASGEGNWNIHPAFYYFEDNRAISGIWVAKFEASQNGSTLQVKPGVTSWRNINMNNSFNICKNYNTTLNSHMMKNSEWGAVTYLAQSEYGKNEEIWINNSSSYITGSAGNSANAGKDVGTTNDYTSDQGQEASTTGNVYGIYDMNGGAWDIVAAYINNGNVGSYASVRSELINAPSYMKDVYNTGTIDSREQNYEANAGKYGDAIYEVSTNGIDSYSWYKDAAILFPYGNEPVFARSGMNNDSDNAGIFAFASSYGSFAVSSSFRPTLCVQ